MKLNLQFFGGGGASLRGGRSASGAALDVPEGYSVGERMGVSALTAAPLGTRVIDRNGVMYIKGQDELPWRRADGNGRASSTILAQSLGARRLIEEE